MRVKEIKKAGTGAVDLTEANIIITGGRAISSPINFKMLRDCAQALVPPSAPRGPPWTPATPPIACSRSDRQDVSPKLHIASGVSEPSSILPA